MACCCGNNQLPMLRSRFGSCLVAVGVKLAVSYELDLQHSTVVTHDDLTKQGFLGCQNNFFSETILSNLKQCVHFLVCEGVPVKTGSLAPLRCAA
jgi:hypothetical protein